MNKKEGLKKVTLFFYYGKGLIRIPVNLISAKCSWFRRKSKILFCNFQIKIENWKLKKKCLFSIFNFEMKLKCAKMPFSISILIWKLNGTFGAVHGLNIFHFSDLIIELKKEKWKKHFVESILI